MCDCERKPNNNLQVVICQVKAQGSPRGGQNTELETESVVFEFEETKLEYTKPQKVHTYTPDFYLPKQEIFIETKGLFTSADRQKMRLVKEQHPDLDIRFIFNNSKSRISKKSKTTYGMWCDKYGFPFADKHLPQEWL